MLRVRPFQSQMSRRATAGLLSAVLHAGLLVLIVLSGGRGDGVLEDPADAAQWVQLASGASASEEGLEQGPLLPETPADRLVQAPSPLPIEPAPVPPPDVDLPISPVDETAPADAADDVSIDEVGEVTLAGTYDSQSALVMPRLQAVELAQRVEQLAEDMAQARRARVAWEQDGRHYEAELLVAPAPDGVQLDRMIAEIHTQDQGRRLRTSIRLKRLPFSHFAQVIDRWDPMVQLHDDEILGRMHVNSRFNVLFDSKAAPRVLGRVTTAARGFNMDGRGRGPDTDFFLKGVETRARPVLFSRLEWSPEWAKHDESALVHELGGKTRIRFLGSDGYSWLDQRSGSWQHAHWPAGRSVYFVAAPGATVYVKGVVSGRFLVYSPERIVVEGTTVYARDPRDDPDSDDFLGLVSDRDIVVASPEVTGPGDLDIHAALYARRRIVVTETTHPRTAMLNILGSLAAGTLTESEPRYSTRVEYDRRFDRRRPPGFPSTNRFAIEDWDRQWTEVAEAPPADGPEPGG